MEMIYKKTNRLKEFLKNKTLQHLYVINNKNAYYLFYDFCDTVTISIYQDYRTFNSDNTNYFIIGFINPIIKQRD